MEPRPAGQRRHREHELEREEALTVTVEGRAWRIRAAWPDIELLGTPALGPQRADHWDEALPGARKTFAGLGAGWCEAVAARLKAGAPREWGVAAGRTAPVFSAELEHLGRPHRLVYVAHDFCAGGARREVYRALRAEHIALCWHLARDDLSYTYHPPTAGSALLLVATFGHWAGRRSIGQWGVMPEAPATYDAPELAWLPAARRWPPAAGPA